MAHRCVQVGRLLKIVGRSHIRCIPIPQPLDVQRLLPLLRGTPLQTRQLLGRSPRNVSHLIRHTSDPQLARLRHLEILNSHLHLVLRWLVILQQVLILSAFLTVRLARLNPKIVQLMPFLILNKSHTALELG